jgi:hypothetical protein
MPNREEGGEAEVSVGRTNECLWAQRRDQVCDNVCNAGVSGLLWLLTSETLLPPGYLWPLCVPLVR